jgi:hypothetical protein
VCAEGAEPSFTLPNCVCDALLLSRAHPPAKGSLASARTLDEWSVSAVDLD